MKWFRHMSNASDDEFIAALESEFDDSGFAWWWRMLERVAATMDNSNRCHAEYPIDKWMVYLHIKRRKKLESFLEFCRKSQKISYEFSGNFLKIKCPKLLELRDEYSRKSGQTPDKCPDKVAPEEDTEYIPSEDKSSSGGDPPQSVDLKKTVFDHGVRYLTAETKKSEATIRKQIGRWVSQYGEGQTLSAMSSAQRMSAVDPPAYIETALRRTAGGGRREEIKKNVGTL